MKNLLIMSIFSLALMGCDQRNTPNNPPPRGEEDNTGRYSSQNEDKTSRYGSKDYDKSGSYVRDNDKYGNKDYDKSGSYNVRDYDYDNTEINVRDRDLMSTTPMDQSESEGDRTITQRIRQALMSDDSLSTNGKNIKIITIQGVVTLRGPVASSQERDAIVKKVKNVRGIVRVDNQLDVTRNNNK